MMGIEYLLDVSLQHYLVLGLIVFSIGLLVVLTKEGLFMLLMGIELMLNGINIIAVSFSHFAQSVEGHVMTFFILAVAAAEIAVGLVIALSVYKEFRSTRLSNLEQMKH